MTKVFLISRYLLGLIFVVFGLNGFLNFLPQPQLAQPGLDFIIAMANTGYFLKFLKFMEILGGLLVLSPKHTALGAAILAPITVNIFLFHLFLDSAGLGMAIIVLGLNLLVAIGHKDKFAKLVD